MTPKFSCCDLRAIELIYGAKLSEIKIPDGYEATGEMRYPTSSDEHWLGVGGPIYGGTTTGARIILRRKPRRRYIFEETGEVRPPRRNEWYLNYSGNIGKALESYDEDEVRTILTRREETF